MRFVINETDAKRFTNVKSHVNQHNA